MSATASSSGLRQGRQASKNREGGRSQSSVGANGQLNLRQYDNRIDRALDKAGIDLEGNRPRFDISSVGGTSAENRASRKEKALAKEKARRRDHRSALALATDVMPERIREKARTAEEEMGKFVRKGTSRLLTQSWINLIDSFGTTLIYIHIHVFLRLTLGTDFFCKLGHEWYDVYAAKVERALNSADNAVNRFLRRQLDHMKTLTGIVEVLVLLIIDLLILFVFIMVLVMAITMALIVTMPIWGPFYMGSEILSSMGL